MSVELTVEKIEEIESKILKIIQSSLLNGSLKEPELQPVSSFVLDNIKKVRNETELNIFYTSLIGSWPIFSSLIENTQAKDTSQEDARKVQEITNELKNEAVKGQYAS